MQTARINGSRVSSRPDCSNDDVVCKQRLYLRFKIKIGELTLAKVTQTSTSCPAISSSLHISRICFFSAALQTFLFLDESLSIVVTIFHFLKGQNVNKTHFPATKACVSQP